MSRFYGSFNSDCTKTSTKRGHEYVSAHVRGWDIGLDVIVCNCPFCGADQIAVYKTCGSNCPSLRTLVYEECAADCQK